MKLEFKKEYSRFYAPPSGLVQEITMPVLHYLMLDGRGVPGDETFQSAIQAMYGIAYGIKMDRKKAGIEPDYTLGPLEALWWMDGAIDPERGPDWHWRLMLWVPDFVTPELVSEAARRLKQKRENPHIDSIRLEEFAEGRVIQTMHLGPYDTVEKSIKLLQDYASLHGLELTGRHHEVYLSDPRRTAPEKIRTIARHPVV